MGDTTRRLFERMKSGDREAFDRFFQKSTPRVLVYIRYNMGPRLQRKLDCADILQNLYLNLYRNFGAFSRQAAERGVEKTLIRMADHEITEAYRYYFKTGKRDAQREVIAAYMDDREGAGPSALDNLPIDETSITARVRRRDEYQRILRVLGTLKPIEQYITVARVIEGLTVQEIADLLGKTRGAVHMILARARDKLREKAGGEAEA